MEQISVLMENVALGSSVATVIYHVLHVVMVNTKTCVNPPHVNRVLLVSIQN
jgi:hypothetical protein